MSSDDDHGQVFASWEGSRLNNPQDKFLHKSMAAEVVSWWILNKKTANISIINNKS